jgi:transcriptional regulator
MTRRKADLLQGTLDLLILKTLALEPMHGWGVSKRIREMSQGVLEVNQGSLYPGLYRLRDRGLIRSRWEITEEQRRVKIYELTKAGREALETEKEDFRLFVGSVERILGTT